MAHGYHVYILTNDRHTVLYTSVTNDLPRRVGEHREKMIAGFTNRYNVDKLVFYEQFADVREATAREKRIKGGSRQRKIALINGINPEWRDLFEDLV
jgi:putative endonuclease